MTASWLEAGLPGLHVDLGEHTRPWAPDYGYWIRPPAADYRCDVCGRIESASGAAVPAFVATIHRDHTCTTTQTGSTS